MSQKTNDTAINSAVTALLCAAGVGFVAGLLLAPKSGKETTSLLSQKAREAKARFDSKKKAAKDDLKDTL